MRFAADHLAIAFTGALIVLCGCAQRAPVDVPPTRWAPETQPDLTGPNSPPAGVRLSVETDKPDYFLGENILLNFRVENVGASPFSIDSSDESAAKDDWRVRDPRYRVTATAADGTAAPPASVYPDRDLTLAAGPFTLQPGQVFYETIPLARFVMLDRPGRYRVVVRNNLGWKWTERDRSRVPDASTVIVVRMPTPKEAAQVVARSRQLLSDAAAARTAARDNDADDDFPTLGKKQPPWADFATMRFPVYVPALFAAARDGVADAVQGLELIDTPEATTALMDLLDRSDALTFAAASAGLEMRLPDNQHGRHHRYAISGPSMAATDVETAWWQHMVSAAWRPAFSTRLREWARARIQPAPAAQAVDPDRRWFATELLQDLGTALDFPLVMTALNAELSDPNSSFGQADFNAPEDGGLVNAADSLIRFRGATLPPDPQRVAEIVVYLREVYDDRAARLPNWDDRLAGWLRHANRYVRASAAGCLPRVPSPRLKAMLPHLATDPDPLVQQYFLSWVRGDHVLAALPLVERMRERPLDPAVKRDVDATLEMFKQVPPTGSTRPTN